MLADIAGAVIATQKEMDRLANESPGDLPLAPLAFVVRQTEVTLLGTLSVPRSSSPSAKGRELTFAQVDRVQAVLRGSHGAMLGSRISVAIQAVQPPHGS
ncbi:MAG: hypothetical protein ACKVYV_18905 [Limisphaerales bacterium]